MFSFVIWSLLTILKLGASNACCIKTDLANSSYCAHNALKAVSQKMDLLESGNKVLRLKLDVLDMKNDKHFGEIKDAVSGIFAFEKNITRILQQEAPKCDCNATPSTIVSPSPDKLHTLTTSTINSTDSSSYPSVSSYPSSFLSTSSLPSSCVEALRRSSAPKNGPQLIHIPNSNLDPFFVYCYVDPWQNGTSWTLIQRRRDGAINFNRNWDEYRRGFGNLEGDFFIGLKRLHALTQYAAHELWIQMEDFDNATRWAKYSSFAVGDETDGYALNKLGAFSGDAGDSLTYHAGQKFLTHDKDNGNCTSNHGGAWWYNACARSNLNGPYLKGGLQHTKYGIFWIDWRGAYYSLKYVHMAIRPLNKENINTFLTLKVEY